MSIRVLPTRQHQAAVERRATVAALRLAGVRNQRQIAAQLGVSQGTVSRDFAALDAEWQARAAADIATEKGRALDRYERLVQAHWPDAINGRWLATDRVLAAMAGIERILGLEAPVKVDITQRVRDLAAEFGLDPEAAVVEAQRILRAGSPRR